MYLKRHATSSINVMSYAQGGTLFFSLEQTPAYNEIMSMFDQYKICMVKIQVSYTAQPQAQTATTPVVPGLLNFLYAKDYTDAVVPTSILTLGQYQNMQSRALDASRPFIITLKPAFSRSIYSSAVSTAYGPGRGFVQTNDYTVPHYGIKYWIQPTLESGTDLLGKIILNTTYYIAGRNVK